MKRALASLLGIVLMASVTMAGPYRDFEAELREAWKDYRMALFATNAGKGAEADRALATLLVKWQSIAGKWGDAAPPQYADDPHWRKTIDAVQAIATKAAREVKAAKLGEAHETLEAIRSELGELHERNGVITFTDRMNAFHAKMEELLAIDLATLDSERMETIEELAGVLKYTAAEALSHPPAEAQGTAEFEELGKALQSAVESVVYAARVRETDKLKAAAGKLKPAYARLFVKFG